MAYVLRTAEAFFKKASSQFPVMVVTGARQVGKTTFLQHLRQTKRTYVTLDDPLVRELAKHDPALFMQRFTPPLLIDEIQYATELLPYIKMAVDLSKKPGQFWLTGSQQFHLMKGVSESLAGRAGIVSLLGLSRRESMQQASTSTPFIPEPSQLRERLKTSKPLSLRSLYAHLWRGSFPALALSQKVDRDLFYSSYVQTYLQRDVRDLTNSGDHAAFLRFLRVAAARTAQILNREELARDADISPNTAKHWLSILQSSGIVFLLEPYHTNLTKRLIKAPKLYFLDTGLCAYLTGWSTSEALEAGAMSGAILETWIVTEILKSWWHNGKSPSLFYYRDKDQKEVDILIVQNQTIYPIECKKTASPTPDAVRHFQTLNRLSLTVGSGGVVCFAQDILPLTINTVSIPVRVI